MTAFMEAAITTAAAYSLGAMGLAVSAVGLKARLELSKAKHRSLAGHARIARFVASLVPFYQYDESADLQGRRGTGGRCRAAARRFCAAGRSLPQPICPYIGADGRGHRTDLGSAIHRGVSRPVSVQPIRAPTLAGRRVSANRRPGSRRPTSTETRFTTLPALTASICSATISTRNASTAAWSACMRSARYWAPIIRWSPTMPRASRACRAWTRFRSTCPGRRP